ncbi:MAG TPA: FtsX-like permease family protein [Acidimicrobiales bacterium]|nr:FtsX-like permease family protein [Acidimicrobiales bacterium]
MRAGGKGWHREVAVGAVIMVFRAELRRRWKAWLALAVLIGIVGGLVLAFTAAGRRTASAYPAFIAAHGYDVALQAQGPMPHLTSLPEVESATEAISAVTGQPSCACTGKIDLNGFSVFSVPRRGLTRMASLVAGRMPDPSSPNQVLASFTLQQDDGVHVGTVLHVPFYAASQFNAVANATGALPRATGPRVALHVVGIEAAETEFPIGATPVYDVYTTPSFARQVLPHTAEFPTYFVRLRGGANDIARFKSDVGTTGIGGTEVLDTQAELVASSIHPQAVGWWLLAVLTVLAGLAMVGQAIGRQSAVEGEGYETLRVLGLTPGQLVGLGMARTFAVGLVGAAGAVVLAFALSPVAPLGEARFAETSTGPSIDHLVLPIGFLATIAAVLLVGMWPSIRQARRADDRSAIAPRPSRTAKLAASAGAPLSAVVGARHALDRGRGRSAMPVPTALLGTVLAILVLSGTAVFGGSLTNLTATPALYGDSYQMIVYGSGLGIPERSVVAQLEHNPHINRISVGFGQSVLVNGVSVQGIGAASLRGPLLLSTITGAYPRGDGQIALGAATMRAAGAHVGSIVRVTVRRPQGGSRSVPFHVVGGVAFPTGIGNGAISLGVGAAFSTHGLQDAICPLGPGQAVCLRASAATHSFSLLVGATHDRGGRAAITHYLTVFQSNATVPTLPGPLVNFGQAVNFPLILGVVVSLFGMATLLHLLVVTVPRRRRDMGVLKSLGFLNRQVGATVYWQATTVAAVGLVIGIPLGVAAGKLTWNAFAQNIGVVPVSVVQADVIVFIAIGALVVANLLAIGPAFAAARSRAGRLLTTR